MENDAPTWPLGPLPLNHAGHQQPPRRVHFARLLQDAHNDQKRNTRALEQSYHALRTSSRELERRWAIYCGELEAQLGVPDWQDLGRRPIHIPRAERSRQTNEAALDEDIAEANRTQPVPHIPIRTGAWGEDEYTWHPHQRESPIASPNRPQPEAAQSPQSKELHPLRQNPPSKHLPHVRKVSLPMREQLVLLGEAARQRQLFAQSETRSVASPMAIPSINIVPPTPPESRQGVVDLQQQPRLVSVVDVVLLVPQPRPVSVHDSTASSLPRSGWRARLRKTASMARLRRQREKGTEVLVETSHSSLSVLT